MIGDAADAEFRRAFEAASHQAVCVELPSLAKAIERLAGEEEPPELAVVLQNRPGQVALTEIERLQTLAPLTRFVALLGSWCEGETRTGQPWPGFLRIYTHQWQSRLLTQFERLRCGKLSAWALPPTATDDERVLWSSESIELQTPGLVTLHTSDYELSDWLAKVCRGGGLASAWMPDFGRTAASGAVAAIFDLAQGSQEEWVQLESLVERMPGQTVIALCSFPRPEDQQRSRDMGVFSLLGKPVCLEDLCWLLQAAGRNGA